jgi:hypothetical protein
MKARNIVVQNRTFCWLRGHIHEQHGGKVHCAERVAIYAESNKKGGLVVLFNSLDEQPADAKKWCVDGFQDGVVFSVEVTDGERQIEHVNFNRPAVIAKLITYFLDNGWDPDTSKKTDIRHGISLLNEMALPEGMLR